MAFVYSLTGKETRLEAYDRGVSSRLFRTCTKMTS
jgi:hypothetical protein